MRVRVLVMAFVLVASVLYARIGESAAGCEQRYGAPIRVSDGLSLATYRSRRMSIVVHFSEGVADMLSFQRLPSVPEEDGTPFADKEILDLLEANGQGRIWVAEAATTRHTSWRTGDGALYAVFDRPTNHLVICTEVFERSGGLTGGL